MRKSFVSVCAGLVAILSFPAFASADEFELFLDDGRLQLNSGTADEVDVLAPPNASSNLSGEIDGTDITVPSDGAEFTPFRLDGGVRFEFTPLGDILGYFDEASGALEFQPENGMFAVFRTDPDPAPGGGAVGCLTGFDSNLFSSGTSPDGEFAGADFTEGLFGPGSVVGSWEGLPVSTPINGATDEECAEIDAAYGGPGAVELGFPVGPELTTKVTPRRNTIKPGGRPATYRLEVRATDSDEPANAKVCGQLRRGISVVGGNCTQVRGVDADGKTVAVKIKASRNADPGLYDTLALLADAPGYSGGASRIEVKVARR